MYICIMHVIAKSTLVKFWQRHQTCAEHLRAWYWEASKGTWKTFHDIKRGYPTADHVGNNRVVFNIKGNEYRLIVKVEYKLKKVFIRFIGTHQEYDRIKNISGI